MKKLVVASCAVGLLLTVGCGRSGQEGGNAAETSAAPGLSPDNVNGATLTGRVNFTGEKPVVRDIDMSANPACQKLHAGPVRSQEVVLNGDGTLANAFVWVKAGVPEGTWAAPAKAIVVDQKGCMYEPHMVGVVTGQKVEFRNSDATNHNIHPLPQKNQEWNESQPPNGEAMTKVFDREEVMVPLKCNIHPWMRAYVGVVRHPFFAVTGADGRFTIAGLPAGKYTVEVWHEKYGVQDVEVSVGAKETKTVDFSVGNAAR